VPWPIIQRTRVWAVATAATFEGHKDLFAVVQAIATIMALVAGGIWTYALSSQFRETQPKLGIKQDISSWKLHDGSTLIRVDSTLTNTSKVRIRGINGKMIVIRLLPETDQQAIDYAANKILFDCKDEHGMPLPDCVPEQGLNLPPSSTHRLPIKDLTSDLEPGESVPYWRYVHLDGDVRTIEVFTSIEKPDRAGDEWVFDSVFNLSH
jgi:hypothetical protein